MSWQVTWRGRLSRPERWLLVAAGGLVLTALVLPIWRFHLWAPQYPEGLKLDIFARTLGGPVQNINILNHYVGMKPLDPATFPEFRWLSPVLASLGGLLVAAGLAGRRELGWLAWLALLGFDAYMLFDLETWLYRWGHDLSPMAPIRFAPFTPPLLGYKQIANFAVFSYPSWGGAGVVLATLLGLYAASLTVRRT